MCARAWYRRPMSLVGQIAELQNYATYKELSWEGSFEDYLALVRRNPSITRQLKKGIEEYSRTSDGALYTYYWNLPGALSDLAGGAEVFPSPMHDEPLRLIPQEWRQATIDKLKLGSDDFKVKIFGDVNPACRLIFKELMRHYGGNFEKVMSHVKVKRLVLSEQD